MYIALCRYLLCACVCARVCVYCMYVCVWVCVLYVSVFTLLFFQGTFIEFHQSSHSISALPPLLLSPTLNHLSGVNHLLQLLMGSGDLGGYSARLFGSSSQELNTLTLL